MKKIALLILSTIVFGCITDDGLTDKTEYSKFIIGNSIATGINFMPEEIYSTNEVQKPLLKHK